MRGLPPGMVSSTDHAIEVDGDDSASRSYENPCPREDERSGDNDGMKVTPPHWLTRALIAVGVLLWWLLAALFAWQMYGTPIG